MPPLADSRQIMSLRANLSWNFLGQVIAKVGDTGESNGPHLHFEIWKNNRVLDPRDLIEEYKKKDVSIR